MSDFKKKWLQQGWMRALIFFAVFLIVFLSAIMATRILKIGVSPLVVNTVLFASSKIILVFIFRKYADKKSLASLGFRFSLRFTITGLLLAAGLLALVLLIFRLTGSTTLTVADAITPDADWWLACFLMFVVALSEETLFRGYVLNNLLQSMSRWKALSVSALMFAFMHTGNPNITAIAALNILLAGLLLGVNYIYTGNLWFGIAFHFTWNLLLGPVLGYNVSGVEITSVLKPFLSGNELLTGGSFGPEGSVVTSLVLGGGVLVYDRVLKKGEYRA